MYIIQVGPKTLVLGENAIKHGLATSLVERLNHHYNGNRQWISNLLINYRSHEAIMRLSSNLFYNSTVESKSASRLHPSTCYPLHFVCASVANQAFKNVSDINEDEITAVLEEVKYYTDPWPMQWGRKERASVCIVASSRNQVRCQCVVCNSRIMCPSDLFSMYTQACLRAWCTYQANHKGK